RSSDLRGKPTTARPCLSSSTTSEWLDPVAADPARDRPPCSATRRTHPSKLARFSRHEESVPSSQSAPINRPIESEKAETADAPTHWTQRPTNAGTSSSAPSTY